MRLRHWLGGYLQNTHDVTIDQLAASRGISIGSGGNGFFANPCTNSNGPFGPVEAPMGGNNTFSDVCYSSTDIASLEPVRPCK